MCGNMMFVHRYKSTREVVSFMSDLSDACDEAPPLVCVSDQHEAPVLATAIGVYTEDGERYSGIYCDSCVATLGSDFEVSSWIRFSEGRALRAGVQLRGASVSRRASDSTVALES